MNIPITQSFAATTALWDAHIATSESWRLESLVYAFYQLQEALQITTTCIQTCQRTLNNCPTSPPPGPLYPPGPEQTYEPAREILPTLDTRQSISINPHPLR